MLFSEKVSMIADEKGMNQVEIAEAAGISKQRVHSVMHGRTANPRLDTIIYFAIAFDMDVAELLDGVEVG